MKTYISLLVLSFIFIPKIALGGVIISEIMYDLEEGSDSGREWVEVKNNGSESVDLSSWKLHENGTNHSLKISSGEDSFLASGSYVIVADNVEKFLADWPEFKGTVFDSSFSLKNSGETLIIRNESLVDIDKVDYVSDWGAVGDGNSLQLIGGKWQAGIPTPGFSNGGAQGAKTTQGTIESNTSSQTSASAPASDFPTEPQIYAFLSGDTAGVVGGFIQFEGMALGLKKEPLSNARFLWNFGDGSFKEGKNVSHIYNYPGDYIVFLNVSSGEYSAVARMNVEIAKSNLKITNVNLEANGESLVELYNDSVSEVDVSYWSLRSANMLFTFPKNSFIGAESKLTLSSLVTKLNIDESKKVELLYPNGSVFYSYDAENKISKDKTSKDNLTQVYKRDISTASVPSSSGNSLRRVAQVDDKPEESSTENDNLSLDETLDKNQTASIISFQDIQGEDEKSNKWIFFVGGFSLVGVLGVVFARRRIDTVS